jgi:predicted nuclease of predicted toxin-antitoxin system
LKLKLDENLNPAWTTILKEAGHDATSVVEQKLAGAVDTVVAEACRQECRALITADIGFGQVVDYLPERYAGLIVLRHPQPTRGLMRKLFLQVVDALERESPAGRLSIVEPGRIRIHGGGATP